MRDHLGRRKTPGLDKITAIMIKELSQVAEVHLTLHVNGGLRLNHFSNCWAISIITIIPKSGKDLAQVSSYRLISLLPTLLKSFENLRLPNLTSKLMSTVTRQVTYL